MWPAALGGQGAHSHPPGPAHRHPWGAAAARGCYLLESSPWPGLLISKLVEPWQSPWMPLGWLEQSSFKLSSLSLHPLSLDLDTGDSVLSTSAELCQSSGCSPVSHLSQGNMALLLQRDFHICSHGSPTSPPQGETAQHWWVKARLPLHWLWAQVCSGGFTAKKAEA